jgi:hypothetical protein
MRLTLDSPNEGEFQNHRDLAQTAPRDRHR